MSNVRGEIYSDRYYEGYSDGVKDGKLQMVNQYGKPEVITQYIIVTQEAYDKLAKSGKLTE